MPAYDQNDIARIFQSNFVSRGKQYYRDGRVSALTIQDQMTLLITSVVKGSGARPYRVVTRIEMAAGRPVISGRCSCPVSFNCKHVVAVLFKALDAMSETHSKAVQPGAATATADWINRFARLPDSPSKPASNTAEKLLYVLKNSGHTAAGHATALLYKAKVLKTGGWSTPVLYSNQGNVLHGAPPLFLTQQDLEIIADLNSLKLLNGISSNVLSGKRGASLLSAMIATERCFWGEVGQTPLRLAPARTANPVWQLDEKGMQQLKIQVQPGPAQVVAIESLRYIDTETGECGELSTSLPAELASVILAAPPVPADETQWVAGELARLAPDLPAPVQLPRKIRKNVIPVPVLTLFSMETPAAYRYGSNRIDRYASSGTIDVARFELDYQGILIQGNAPERIITRQVKGELLSIPRHAKAEKKAEDQLGKWGFKPASAYGMADTRENQGCLLELVSGEWLEFTETGIPALRAKGWRVEIEASYQYQFAEIEEWYGDIQQPSGNDWFSLELGIQIDGERINLLPVMLDILDSLPGDMTPEMISRMPDEIRFISTLPDGRLIALPAPRIRGLLNILQELFEDDFDETDRIRLPGVQAGRLAELDATAGLNWQGGERVLELSRKLHDFKGIKKVTPPDGLTATLRGYQKEGLNWLQFLREYNLAGILADDMGLGKTIQTLAHILTEKQQGRLEHPALVIAPTSLMFNWQREAQMFAPSLKVLILQGASRKQRFDQIAGHDLVLTTYPLLPRDKETLTSHPFHLLILDEAHIIKNPKSQATQIVRQIKANHRLCLTGTPMENHLGELWSLFHFLMPGLLGDMQHFRKHFRTPIEKQGNEARRNLLSRRIAPFLLRRTKEQVAQELPPKTEILRSVQLSGAQRDLYETIRVAMQQKVKQEIEKKGFSRSQIVILDALLKLRQTCCDPRLLKLESARQIAVSAKLEMLMELLPGMVEEGRKILLFSQFTSMLALIEQELAKHGIEYVKLTGQTKDRATPVAQFQNGEIPLFLISLKAGGIGLNLTAADTVIHYDPWWNPAVESQATDRAHRIGQNKPVFVYKLITEGTVEEKMVAMQEKKRQLANLILDVDGKETVAITAEDLEALFEPLI